jgi:hypothetical protein
MVGGAFPIPMTIPMEDLSPFLRVLTFDSITVSVKVLAAP